MIRENSTGAATAAAVELRGVRGLENPHCSDTDLRRIRQRQRVVPHARLELLARRLHALGERPLYEYLLELSQGADAIARLEAYAQLDPEIIHTLGGDRLSSHLQSVEGVR